MVNGSSFEEPEVNMKSKMKNTRYGLLMGSEKGFVLVMSLLLLLTATVVGITALSTSTTNVMMAGNQRLSELNFSAADSGVPVSSPIVNKIAFSKRVSSIYTTGTDPLIKNPDAFLNEILHGEGTADCPVFSASCSVPAPDIDFAFSDVNTYIDIDYMYAASNPGGPIEFASGYDGLGHGAGAGGVGIYYEVTSVGQGLVGSETVVDGIYRYVPQ